MRYSGPVSTSHAKVNITARIAPSGRDAIDERAKSEGLDRSDTIRLMLAYANKRMPPGWRPKGWQPTTVGRPRKATSK